MISGERYRYSPVELQCWVSLLAAIIQMPLLIYNVDFLQATRNTSLMLFLLYVFNGVSYHVQSVAAYAVMSYISPITHR